MPGRARRHKDRRNRRRDCGDSLRESVWRFGRAAAARDVARYAGAVRADARRTLSAQREKGFLRREGAREVLKQVFSRQLSVLSRNRKIRSNRRLSDWLLNTDH